MNESPVIFLYDELGEVRSAWANPQAFKNVAGLCESAPHIVEYLAGHYAGSYQAFWYDEADWAPGTDTPRPDVLMVVEKYIGRRGISYIKNIVLSRNDLKKRVNEWQRLVRLPETKTEIVQLRGTEDNTVGNRIFIVHGRDLETLKELDLTLHKIGLDPITFKSLPKKGSVTNIELLEKHIPEVDGIVCLMTPDDEGRERVAGHQKKPPLKPRARENVLIEAGYAVIGNREYSLLIAIGGVSIPSDFEGIQRLQSQQWTDDVALRVAKRLSEMGFSVDIAKLL